MAINTGQPFCNTTDGYLCEGTDVKGAYFVIDAIGNAPAAITQTGSLCYCTGDSKFYQYNGSSWVVASFSDMSAYLPKSGGIITGTAGDTPLYIKSAHATGSFIGFKSSDDTLQGYLGVNSGKPIFYDNQNREIALKEYVDSRFELKDTVLTIKI